MATKMARLPAIPAILASWLVVLGQLACGSADRAPQAAKLDPFPRSFKYQHNYQLFGVTNGLTVALVPEAKTNLVSVDVRYRVGASEDPPGKEGLAHFVEHLMFEVRHGGGEKTLNEDFNEAALVFNAYTNFDETHYTATALEGALGKLLSLEAARMNATCDSIDDEHIERSRQIVKREIGERSGVGSAVNAMLAEAVFPPEHPYRRGLLGSAPSIDAVTRADICAFIADHYGPNRAFLIVSGNIDVAKARALVGRTFGPIKKVARGKRAGLSPLELGGSRSEHSADIEKPALAIAFPAPPWGSAPSIDQGLLFGILESRLKEDLVGELGVTAVASGQLGGWRGGAHVLILGLTASANPTKVTDAVFKAATLMARTLTPLEVDIYKAHYRQLIVGRHAPYAGRAREVADYLQYTDHLRFLLMDLERVENMTVSRLQRLQREGQALDYRRSHIALIKPSAALAKQESANPFKAGREFDLEPWRAAVDPALAEEPMDAVIQRPSRRISRFVLASGLKVVMVPNFEYPTVEARLVVPAGTAADPVGKPGVAKLAGALLEDDLEALATNASLREFVQVAKMGGGVSAAVNEDYTAFSVRGLSLFSDGLLWQLYFRLHSGAYDPAELNAFAKRASAADFSDAPVENAAVRAALFGADHPYAQRPSPRAVRSISRRDLERFRDAHYLPAGATLIVTGQFDEVATRQRIERLWGGAARPATDPLAATAIPLAARAPGASAFVVEDAERVQPLIVIAYALDATATAAAERLVLRELLSQRLASIRERLGASYGLQVSLEQARGPSLLTISGEVEPARAAEAFTEIRASIAAVRSGDPGLAADFVRARRHVVERLLADSADATSTAGELEHIAALGLAEDHFGALASKVAALTLSQLDLLSASDLGSAREVIILRGPRELTKNMFDAAGIRGVKEVR